MNQHILYESDRNTKIGTLKPDLCRIKKVHIGSWYLEMEHKNKMIGSYIDKDLYIKAPTPSGPQFFKIQLKQVINENNIRITAFHRMYDLSKDYVKDTNIVNKNRVDACKQILANTLREHDFTVEGHGGLDKLNNLRIVGYDPFNAIVGSEDNTVVNRYKNTEWDFNNDKILIEDTIGNDNGYLFTYNKNMEELNEEEDNTSLITQIVPVTSYNEKRITLPELTVDSDYINAYDEIITKEIDFTLDEKEEGELTKDEIYNQLREKAKEYFKETECDISKVSYDLKGKDIVNNPKYKQIKKFYQNLNTGDTVTVLKKNGLRLKLRVREYEYDSINLSFESLVINNTFKSISSNVSNTGNKLDNILNNNGSVDTSKLEGIIDAMKAKFSAMRDIAQPSHVKAMIFEDRIKGSATYGAMCLGSMGFMIASERLPDDSDWDWRTFGSGQGFVADHIVTGVLTAILIRSLDGGCTINLETGEVNFNKGKIQGLNSSWDLSTGVFKSFGTKSDGSTREFIIGNGKISSTDWLEFICKSLSFECNLSNIITKLGLWVTQPGKTSPCFSVDIPNKWVMVGQSSQKFDLVVNGQIRAESVAEGTQIYNLDGTEVIYPVGGEGGGSSETQKNVVNSARKLIGRPYVFGGNVSPLGSDEGTDCSGLIQWAYNDNGIKISRTTYTQINEGIEVSEADLKPGDLVFSRFSIPGVPEHVFLYSGEVNGNHMCVEAQKTGTNIMEREFTWVSGMRARRIIKDSTPAVPGGDATSRPSDNIIYFIKAKEGFAPNYYYDAVGVKTLGYGLTGSELNGITPPISEQQATNLLAKAFKNNYYTKVLDIVKAKGVTNAKQREIDAFASFAYKLGVGAFSGSTLLEKYVAGERGEAIHTEFKKWVHAGGEVLPGLVTRREEEWKIFSGSTSLVPGYNSKPSIAVIGGSGVVTTNGGYGAKPQY